MLYGALEDMGHYYVDLNNGTSESFCLSIILQWSVEFKDQSNTGKYTEILLKVALNAIKSNHLLELK
jgi:hypothetical protein